MYNSQDVAKRIKDRAKKIRCPLKTMLSDLNLGINTISHLAKGQGMSYTEFASIAEYLDCSVDYLLGRTDNAESHKTIQQTVFTIKTAARSETGTPIQTEQVTKEELEQHIAEIESFEDIDPNL